MKKWAPRVLLAAALAGLSAFLLKGDVWTFWTWWLLAFLMGMVAMPVTGRLFAGFEDKGWMFSKVLAITVTGFLTWFLVTAKILPFTAATCIGVSIVCAVGCGVLYHFQGKNGIDCFPFGNVNLIYGEEILFFIFFLMWTYFAGFRPQAYGTEKFMDYGFMEAMMRSTTLPARDLWYSEGTINYYYGGQYFAVFLTKLTGSKVELTYNLMRTFVAAFAFVLPFSLVRQMSVDRLKGEFAAIRAGRANPAVLDKAMVDYYGVPTPINQMAAVSVSEARILLIQPWDISTLKAIEKAIMTSDIGITPTNDGKVIRLVFPQPTEEKRKELCKEIKKYGEETKVAVRSIRRDALESLKSMKKEGEITEDDLKDLEKEVQNLTDKFCKNIDNLVSEKEKEIMSL